MGIRYNRRVPRLDLALEAPFCLYVADRFQGWTLTVDRRFSPTDQDWETVEKIADYILSSQCLAFEFMS